jgi:hypothetical protein
VIEVAISAPQILAQYFPTNLSDRLHSGIDTSRSPAGYL